jgi:hypothetical protein
MREPDIVGRGVRAWRLTSTEMTSYGALARWLVFCSWGHIAWNHWLVSVVHLRPLDLPGAKPAVKTYPEAEFEFSIMSIDPDRSPHPDPDGDGRFGLLVPPDVIHQFHGVSDRDAARITESAVRAIARGAMSPDQDFRGWWHRALDATVEHYRSGKHDEH